MIFSYLLNMYLLGIEKQIQDMQPRTIFEKYHFDQMYLGIRPAKLQLDGTYHVDPNSSIIYSNCFIGSNLIILYTIFLKYNSYSSLVDSDSTVNMNDPKRKLEISNIQMAVEDRSLNTNFQWRIKFKIEVCIR